MTAGALARRTAEVGLRTFDAVGPGAGLWAVGSRVMGIVGGGGHSEFVCVHEREAIRVPHNLSWEEAGGFPEVFTTAWLNLFMEGALAEGERVLLHAAASGVGTAAIQLCRAFGHPCFATAGSEAKLAACRELGADAGWYRHDGSFVEAVKAWGGADC